MKLKYTGSTLLITGANSTLGINLTERALQSGLSPVLGCRSEKSLSEIQNRFPQEIETGRIRTVLLDLAQPEKFSAVDWKTVHYLCDLAQPDYESLLASADGQKIEDYFSASVSGRAALLKSALRGMIKNKFGRAVLVSSTAAGRILPGQGFYSASKAAAEQLYKTAGIEMAAKRITTAVLRPGYIEAGRGKIFSGIRDTASLIPTGRILSPEEVAETILFLLSDSALQINASVITMDGGMSSSKPKI